MKKEFNQNNPYESPWSFSHKVKMLLWEYCWVIFCKWTPKPFNRWRIFWLKLFGAKVYGCPFVHQRARIQIPWNIILHDHATIGDRTNLYSLSSIEVHENAVLAQESYICTGTHAFNKPTMNLITAPIRIGKDVFVGARAFLMPGVDIGEGAVIGAYSVVVKNVAPRTVVGGNPAKFIKERKVVGDA